MKTRVMDMGKYYNVEVFIPEFLGVPIIISSRTTSTYIHGNCWEVISRNHKELCSAVCKAEEISGRQSVGKIVWDSEENIKNEN